MNSKGIYKEFCLKEKERIPLFHHPFWLDTVSGPENWDVSIIKGKDDQVVAAWPYYKSTKRGISKLSQPMLTQYLGPLLNYPRNIQKKERKHSFELKTLEKCIQSLPAHTVFKQGLHPGLQNWTPFYWKGFRQSTRYSYVINDIKNHETLWAGFKSELKNQIRYAEKNYQISLDESIDNLYQLNKKTYDRKGVSLPLSKEKLNEIYQATRTHLHADILTVRDSEERLVCSTLLVYDSSKAYTLLIGVDKNTKPKGAVQWMLSEAIKKASERVDSFDFEGSMIPEIEAVFRVFGGERIPYSVITKAPIWFRVIHDLLKRKDFSI